MKKCVLILPYFGKFNNYFQLFLNSFEHNTDYDLFVFTDSRQEYKIPENVYFFYESFFDFKDRIKNKFTFDISLETPYKLCDYKPVYGYVLEDLIKEYEYWGFCDCDLLFGDLNGILSPILNKGYDKIFALGHLTLFKNNFENNRVFMNSFNGKSLYKTALSSSNICWFDEDYKDENVHGIFLDQNKSIYCNDLSINPNINSSSFSLKKYNPSSRDFIDIPYQHEHYFWSDGKLLQIKEKNNQLNIKSYLYMHFQLRKMRLNNDIFSNSSTIYIYPNGFKMIDKVPETLVEWKSFKKIEKGPQNRDLLIKRIKKKVRK